MNINLTREEDKTLNINNVDNYVDSAIKLERNKPSETIDDSLKFMMNSNAKKNIMEDYSNDLQNDYQSDNQSVSINESASYNGSNISNEIYNQNNYSDPNISYEEIEREKAKMLSKLGRLSQNSKLSARRLNSSHSLEEIKAEVYRLEKDLEIINGVEAYKHGLIFLTSMMEKGAVDYMGINTLKNYSTIVSRDVNSNNYDQVLEEIYEIWGGAGLLRPEIKLLLMLGGTAYTVHLQNLIANQHYYTGRYNKQDHVNTQQNNYENFAKPMKGPSEDTDDILRRLAEENVSDISSVASVEKPIKKRGRPKKNT